MRFRSCIFRHELLAGCLILAAPLAVMAQPPEDARGGNHGACEAEQRVFPGPPPEDRPPPYLLALDLTEEQQDKVFVILHGAAPALREQAKAPCTLKVTRSSSTPATPPPLRKRSARRRAS